MAPLSRSSLLLLSAFTAFTSAIPQSSAFNSYLSEQASFEAAGQGGVQASISSVSSACSQNFQPSCTDFGISGPATVSATPTATGNPYQSEQASFEQSGQASVMNSVSSIEAACSRSYQPFCSSYIVSPVSAPVTPTPTGHSNVNTIVAETSRITAPAWPTSGGVGAGGNVGTPIATPAASPAAGSAGSSLSKNTPTPTASTGGSVASGTPSPTPNTALGLKPWSGSAFAAMAGIVAAYFL